MGMEAYDYELNAYHDYLTEELAKTQTVWKLADLEHIVEIAKENGVSPDTIIYVDSRTFADDGNGLVMPFYIEMIPQYDGDSPAFFIIRGIKK